MRLKTNMLLGNSAHQCKAPMNCNLEQLGFNEICSTMKLYATIKIEN